MRRLVLAAILALMIPMTDGAAAQNGRSPSLSDLLRQLQRDPAYAGRIVGTHTVRSVEGGSAFLYEVRILSADDRIVIVHLDPSNGAVVRNSETWLRRAGRR